MKQYCRYCAFCIRGDVYYCVEKNTVLRKNATKAANTCADYVESELGDVDTGKMYKPRKEKENNVEQTKIF